jgi:hypothetical protein
MPEIAEGDVFWYRPSVTLDEPYREEDCLFTPEQPSRERHKVLSVSETELRTTRVDEAAVSDRTEYAWPPGLRDCTNWTELDDE